MSDDRLPGEIIASLAKDEPPIVPVSAFVVIDCRGVPLIATGSLGEANRLVSDMTRHADPSSNDPYFVVGIPFAGEA